MSPTTATTAPPASEYASATSRNLSPGFSLGITYASKIHMSKFKKYAGLFADGGNFDIPENYGAGVAFKPVQPLTVSVDYELIKYCGVPAVSDPSTTPAQLGSTGGPGFGWKDVNVWKVGLEYASSDRWTWRAGYNHTDNPIQSADVTFNILAPGVVTDHLTLGLTHTSPSGGELTVAYMHAFNNSVQGASILPVFMGGMPGRQREDLDVPELVWHQLRLEAVRSWAPRACCPRSPVSPARTRIPTYARLAFPTLALVRDRPDDRTGGTDAPADRQPRLRHFLVIAAYLRGLHAIGHRVLPLQLARAGMESCLRRRHRRRRLGGHQWLTSPGIGTPVTPAFAAELARYHIDATPVPAAAGNLRLVAPGLVLNPGHGRRRGPLLGFGARYAGGCTGGHAIMGLATFQRASLVATLAFMAGGFVMADLILPRLLG